MLQKKGLKFDSYARYFIVGSVILLSINLFLTFAIRPTLLNNNQALDLNDIIIWPTESEIIPLNICDRITLSLPDNFSGKFGINQPYVSNRLDYPRLLKVDTISNEEILLRPEISPSGRSVTFYLAQPLPPGEWQLKIPDKYFEIRPNIREVEEMPFSPDSLSLLSIVGAWHVNGRPWNATPMFSIHDDDGVDGKIPSSGATHIPERTGWFSMLYPLLESLGVRGCVSMEGWRAGFTDDPPKLNDNGKILLRLQNERGWEAQAHSMEVLGQTLNNWAVDSLTSPLAQKILEEGPYNGITQSTPTIFDFQTQKQYFPNDELNGWTESPKKLIKPYIGDYPSKKPILYNPEHDVDYHWGEWFRTARQLGFNSKAWVQHNAISSHNYALAINAYSSFGFSDMYYPYQYNVPPLRSTATRMMMEGQSGAPNYIGESNDDNRWQPEQYKWFIDVINNCIADNGWLIMGLHTYRKCWKNYLPGCLKSEGGDYHDEWVEPLKEMDFLNDPLTPPANLGIKDWKEWYPCPGTRLDMLREIIKYCLDKGMINVTSSEGYEEFGNNVNIGYYNGGIPIGYDSYNLLDNREVYPHYIVGKNGEQSYFCPIVTSTIVCSFTISDNPEIVRNYRDEIHYFNLQGLPIEERNVKKGVYIRLDAEGPHKIVR